MTTTVRLCEPRSHGRNKEGAPLEFAYCCVRPPVFFYAGAAGIPCWRWRETNEIPK